MQRKKEIEQIVRDHHDAFLVEAFGEEGSGLPPERIEDLRQRGILMTKTPPLVEGFTDPFILLRGISKYFAKNPQKYADEKGRTVEDWAPVIKRVLAKLHEEHLAVAGMHHVDGVVHMDDEGRPEVSPGIPVPKDKPVPEGLRPEQGVPVRATFKGASPMDQAAYRQALTRAGEFCRGLGNVWAENLGRVAGEKWNGEDIEASPRADSRDETLKKIRATVAEAWRKGTDRRTLAGLLAKATQDYTRDWRRVATTEMQAAYNDGVAIDAVQTWGKKAKIARVPEKNACPHCRKLFVADGKPILWDVFELVRNGTNVGRVRANWKATLFPIHPRCACIALSIPPGYGVDGNGRLVKTGKTVTETVLSGEWPS